MADPFASLSRRSWRRRWGLRWTFGWNFSLDSATPATWSRWVGEWVSEWVSECDQVSEWVSEWVSGWVSEWSIDWVIKWVTEFCSTERTDTSLIWTSSSVFRLQIISTSTYQFEILHVFYQLLVGSFEMVSMRLQPLYAVAFMVTESDCTLCMRLPYRFRNWIQARQNICAIFFGLRFSWELRKSKQPQSQ